MCECIGIGCGLALGFFGLCLRVTPRRLTVALQVAAGSLQLRRHLQVCTWRAGHEKASRCGHEMCGTCSTWPACPPYELSGTSWTTSSAMCFQAQLSGRASRGHCTRRGCATSSWTPAAAKRVTCATLRTASTTCGLSLTAREVQQYFDPKSRYLLRCAPCMSTPKPTLLSKPIQMWIDARTG